MFIVSGRSLDMPRASNRGFKKRKLTSAVTSGTPRAEVIRYLASIGFMVMEAAPNGDCFALSAMAGHEISAEQAAAPNGETNAKVLALRNAAVDVIAGSAPIGGVDAAVVRALQLLPADAAQAEGAMARWRSLGQWRSAEGEEPLPAAFMFAVAVKLGRTVMVLEAKGGGYLSQATLYGARDATGALRRTKGGSSIDNLYHRDMAEALRLLTTRGVTCVANTAAGEARVVKRFELSAQGKGRWVYTDPTPHAILTFMHGIRGQNLVSRAQLDVARRFARGDFGGEERQAAEDDAESDEDGGAGEGGGGGVDGAWGPAGDDGAIAWADWATPPGAAPPLDGAGAFPAGEALERVAADFRRQVKAATNAAASAAASAAKRDAARTEELEAAALSANAAARAADAAAASANASANAGPAERATQIATQLAAARATQLAAAARAAADAAAARRRHPPQRVPLGDTAHPRHQRRGRPPRQDHIRPQPQAQEAAQRHRGRPGPVAHDAAPAQARWRRATGGRCADRRAAPGRGPGDRGRRRPAGAPDLPHPAPRPGHPGRPRRAAADRVPRAPRRRGRAGPA